MTYAEKLKDQRWQKKRLELLEASGWRCQSEGCRNPKEKPTLHVHHRLYQRGVEPWGYENWVYQVLCDECHSVEQSLMDRANALLAKQEDLRNACTAISHLPEALQSRVCRTLYDVVGFRPELLEIILDSIDQSAARTMKLLILGAQDGAEMERRKTN